MQKIFLVEDEFVVRNGIRKSIDWEGEGFIFCGDAPDGELAYPLILREKPEILITDIRMPFMDGLELSEVIRRELPQTKIIILSGYEEFAYACQALKLGVAEYILKPISGTDLLECVHRVANQLRKDGGAKQTDEPESLTAGTRRNHRGHAAVERAKDYITKHFAEDISLSVMAGYLGMNPSYFSALFSQETGQNFVQYLTEYRMHQAKLLLRYSNMRPSEISVTIGYKDPHYFSYIFRKTQHCSPSQYRVADDGGRLRGGGS